VDLFEDASETHVQGKEAGAPSDLKIPLETGRAEE
jgi:hypothetical protein